jgi:alginate O-acetyltransferase complex protein AlgI
MLTMLLGGLWHSAGWNFLIWGGLHGVDLCVNQLWQAWCVGDRQRSFTGFSGQAFYWALTFLAVVVAWVFFRAKTSVRSTCCLTCWDLKLLTPPMFRRALFG